jgi:predicted nucleotidyltransferase
MILGGEIQISEERIRSLCTRFRIRKLSLFGSALHGTMKEGSDIDLLVEFEPGHVPGLIALAGMQNEFSALFGHPVDLRTPNDLSPFFRDAVLQEAKAAYASA